MKLRFALMLLVGLLVMATPVSARKWTSSDGKFSVEAELVEAQDGNVRLKRQDGKVITVPVSKLSKADQDYLSSIAKPEKKPEAVKKLTPEQVEEILAYEIGRWETKGRGMPTGGEPQVIEITEDVRWKEKGESVEYEFSMMQDGKKVTHSGYKKYDHSQGIFIVHMKWGDNPETVAHERYAPVTRTYRGQSAPASPPSKNTSTNLMRRVGNDKLLQTLKVFEDGRLVYVQEVVSIRQAASAEPDKPTTDEAIAAIKKLGGKVKADKNKAVVFVDLHKTPVIDAGLEPLKGLTQLKKLDLGDTSVTDAGLVHLKGLTEFHFLVLNNTEVTDAGLAHLKGMTKLDFLDLDNITDAGLVHLEGLTKLEYLGLKNTKVTDAGFKKLTLALQKFLPGR